MNAVIYARYSSDRQTEDSIEAQLRACREYAERKGYKIVTEYKDEAVSGKGSKTQARKQYQKMQKDFDKGLFTAILVHKYDRIARSIAEHINLETKLKQKGIELIAVAQDFGTTNEAKIMRSLMWILSEYYLDNLSELKKGIKKTPSRRYIMVAFPRLDMMLLIKNMSSMNLRLPMSKGYLNVSSIEKVTPIYSPKWRQAVYAANVAA